MYVYCYCSVTKSYSTFCDPMDCSTSGFPVLHYLPDFAQIYVHCISDAIQPSHSVPPSSPFAFILLQYQGHAVNDGPHLTMTDAYRGFSRAGEPVWDFSRGMTGTKSFTILNFLTWVTLNQMKDSSL